MGAEKRIFDLVRDRALHRVTVVLALSVSGILVHRISTFLS